MPLRGEKHMLNERLSAARGIAAELVPAETDVENALVHTSKLVIAIVEGRRKARLPITIGQEGLDHIAQVAERLIDARRELAAAHVALRKNQIEIGLRAVAVGDLWDCPPAAEKNTPQAANVA